MPKISVILPCYNHELYIAKTLDSLLGQTLRDIEIIAVNDGSSDRTGEILDEYSHKDSRVRAYHQNNGGIVEASNTALSHASGEWLAFCGSDDIVPSKAYEVFWSKRANADVIIGEFSEITDGGARTRVRIPRWRECDCVDALFAMPAMWNKIICRRLVTEAGLELPAVLLCEDLIFLAELAALRPRYRVIHQDIYHYRNNPNHESESMTHTYSLAYFRAHIQGRERVLDICASGGLPRGADYVFLDSIRYLSGYLPQMESENQNQAMELLKGLLFRRAWGEKDTYFKSVFGLYPNQLMKMSGQEYVRFAVERSPLDAVLDKYRAGDIGLQFIFRCVTAWADYKKSARKRKQGAHIWK